ncbi:MAG: TldD/PmbA family protein, partial [Candidatus Sumerlaeota bacterium]|nr:TldD/PmbA family protein [Candidatus Sumerlaeota bacterium]
MELCQLAVDMAKHDGASYADARVVDIREQYITTEDERVSGVQDGESLGIGIRVICDGAWGFAASSRIEKASVEETARQAITIARAGALAKAPQGIHWAAEPRHEGIYKTPILMNPFQVALEDKIGLLLAINKEVLAVNGANKCHSLMYFKRQHR